MRANTINGNTSSCSPRINSSPGYPAARLPQIKRRSLQSLCFNSQILAKKLQHPNIFVLFFIFTQICHNEHSTVIRALFNYTLRYGIGLPMSSMANGGKWDRYRERPHTRPNPTPKSVHQMSIFIWNMAPRNCSHCDFFKSPGTTHTHKSQTRRLKSKQAADRTTCKCPHTQLRLLRWLASCTCRKQSVAGLHLGHYNIHHGDRSQNLLVDCFWSMITKISCHLTPHHSRTTDYCSACSRSSVVRKVGSSGARVKVLCEFRGSRQA